MSIQQYFDRNIDEYDTIHRYLIQFDNILASIFVDYS